MVCKVCLVANIQTATAPGQRRRKVQLLHQNIFWYTWKKDKKLQNIGIKKVSRLFRLVPSAAGSVHIFIHQTAVHTADDTLGSDQVKFCLSCRS